ncbi:5730_t:CDS:2, partial [Racocetra fulgida]
IYDDINLPLGSFRYRSQGSGGGHNGVNSIILRLMTKKFKRLRIGVVLGRFSEEERREIANILPQVVAEKLIINGSKQSVALKHKIETINQLIKIYQAQPSLPVDLDEAKKILDQQAGLQELKEIIIKKLETEKLKRGEKVLEEPLILCLVGPSGTGKTTLVQLFAQAAQKKIYSLALGGLSEVSWLAGISEGSGGTEIGQLAKALVETEMGNPIILLEEIDKAGSNYKTAILDYLGAVLDPRQNQEIPDHYLGVKLDFSQTIFIATANELDKIPKYLRSRLTISENFEITPEALTNLIKKTREKGEKQQNKEQSKIIVDSELVNQLIPHVFTNVDWEEEKPKKNDQKNFNSVERK